ncbi:MAG: site-specific DNA-methyltransferase [Thermodesulfobacteriota bacterium]
MAGRKRKDSAKLIWSSKGKAETPPKGRTLDAVEEVFPGGGPSPPLAPLPPFPVGRAASNRLVHGDNLHVMEALIKEGLKGKVKLIYIDPPFASEADYKLKVRLSNDAGTMKRTAYSDRWSGGVDSYLDMLHPRLILMRELLSDDGTIFLHCDWRANSYIKVLMDEIFGREKFLNEIVWSYGGRGAKAVSGQFPRNHDTILVYGRGPGAGLRKVYGERSVPSNEAGRYGFRLDKDGRFFKTAPRGDYTDESIKRLEKEGRVYRTNSGNIRIKYFLEKRGSRIIEKKLIGDVWDDIPDAMHSPVAERTGFTTQKPEALLRRIIESATASGDLVCDFFSGAGTTGSVAEKLGRRWIMCESGRTGVQVARRRLIENNAAPFLIEGVRDPRVGDPGVGAAKAGTRKKKEAACLSVKKPVIKKLKNGKVELSLELKGYSLNGPPPSPAEGAPEEKFPAVIDSWSVDWDFKGRAFGGALGKAFRGTWHSLRQNGKELKAVEKKARAVLEKRPKRIAVRAVDVFGNETEEVVDI